MFIQKLELDKMKSYSTTTTIENITENLQLTFNKVPIVTPYSSKCMEDSEIKNLLKNEKAVIRLTITKYLGLKDSFDCSHVVIEDFNLLGQFGYDWKDIDKPVIVDQKADCFEKIQLFKFFIKAEKSDSFVALYLISQMFKTAVVTKDPERMEMFCKVFRMNCEVYDYEYQDEIDSECVVLMGFPKKINSERVFLIGKKSYGFPSLNLNVNDAGKFKYRINDVVRDLFSHSNRQVSRFDFAKYANIYK